MSASSASGAQRWWAVVVARLAVAVVIGFIACCLLWRAQGGHWERVETPSMGTRAPVGSLLWVRPVDFDTVRVGDFVTVRPPGSQGTYSHLVRDRHADGTLGTQGVLSGEDPWRVAAPDVVGRVEATWWGVGWLVAAAPVVLVGGLLVAAVRGAVRRAWRLPVTLVLGSLMVSTAILVHRPLTGAVQLGSTTDPDGGGAVATFVGTGLLPIRLRAPGGDDVVLAAGEVGSVHVARAGADGLLQVVLRPDVPMGWWVLLVLACFVPALVVTVRDGLRRRRGSPGRASAAGCHRRPRAACP